MTHASLHTNSNASFVVEVGIYLFGLNHKFITHIIVRMLMQCHLDALHPRADPSLAWLHTNKIVYTNPLTHIISTCRSSPNQNKHVVIFVKV